MQQQIFNRYEKKFIVTNEQKDILIKYLSDYLIADQNIINGIPYHIFNLYYDTDDFQIIRSSLEKPVYKDKVRLRSYHYPVKDEDIVYLEIKKKFEGKVNKRRIMLKYEDFINYIMNEKSYISSDYLNQQVLNEINYLLKINQVKPKAYIAYDRIALHNDDDSLRVTFDQNIRYRFSDLTLKNNQASAINNDQNQWLMEIKSHQNFPLWLVTRLSELKIYSSSFSKYGKAYEKHITGGQNANTTITRD